MMKKRFAGLAAACVMVLVSAVGARAAGGGINVGPTILFPTLNVTEAYDSNIALASSGANSDWLLSIAPALRVVVPVRRFFLNAEGGLDFKSYLDVDGENSTDFFVGGAVGGEFPGGLSFRVKETYKQTYLTSTQEYGVGEDTTQNNLNAAVNYAIRDVVRLQLTGALVDYNYDKTLARSRTDAQVKAAAYWKFRPSISALVEWSLTNYSYETAKEQDNMANQASLGLTWDLTAKSTGFAKAGYQWKQYDTENKAAGAENANYFTVSAGLRHALTTRTTVTAELARSSEESDFTENPYFLRTSLGAAITQQFTAKLYGRAALSYMNDAFPNQVVLSGVSDKRSDSTIDVNVLVGFNVLRWLALEMAYNGQQRNSSFDDFTYDVNRVALSAKAAF